MSDDRGELPLQRLLLDLQAGQILLEALGGDLDIVRRVAYGDHVSSCPQYCCVLVRHTSVAARPIRWDGSLNIIGGSCTTVAGPGMICAGHRVLLLRRSGPCA